MHPRDDPSGNRRQYRRTEDSINANATHRLDIVERVTLKHESWFEDMGVGNMSLEQRAALPSTLEGTVEARRERDRWSRRTSALIGFAAAAGALLAPFIEHALGIHP